MASGDSPIGFSAVAVSARLLVGNLRNFVNQRKIEHVGNEPGADAQDFMRAGFQWLFGALLRQHRGRRRLDGDCDVRSRASCP
jgi:hypothetical protein